MKRWIALLTALCLLVSITALIDIRIGPGRGRGPGGRGAHADPGGAGKNFKSWMRVNEEDENVPTNTVGAVYQEKSLSDFDASSPAVYTCKVLAKSSAYTERTTESSKVFYNQSSVTADVLYVGSAWAIIRYEGEIGYIKRDRITNVTAVDPVNTCPYGVQKCTYIARTAVTCPVYKSMSTSDESWVTLNPGTLVGLWVIQDGWAVVPYWRTYGYIPLETLTELIPVSPTDTPLDDDTPIAAYTSYYDMAQNDVNKSRIVNIRSGLRAADPGDAARRGAGFQR